MDFMKIVEQENCVFHCNIDGHVYVKVGETIFKKPEMEEALSNVKDDFDRGREPCYPGMWILHGENINDWMKNMIEKHNLED